MTNSIWQQRKNEPPREDPTRTELEKMRADEWFKYRLTPALAELQRETIKVFTDANALYANDPAGATEMIVAVVASCGTGLDIRPPLMVEYGERVTFGDDVFINADFMVLGPGRVTIGDRVLIGPGARLYTPNHPVDTALRRAGWEIGLPITIEDDAWLGGSVIVCPGVTIGRGSVVGAGSVVTKDVPPGVVVGGNPARVIRDI